MDEMTHQPGDTWVDIPEFGEQVAGCDYQSRPGAYAIIFDAQQRVVVVHTAQGYYLPGGGSAPGETPEETLQREVREECGYAITRLRKVGEAVEWVFATAEQQGFCKHGVFFTASLGRCITHETEPDHTVLWLAPREAITQLSHQSHAWVVQHVALKGRNIARASMTETGHGTQG